MEAKQVKRSYDSVLNYDISLSEELKRVFPLDRQTKPELIVGKSEILDIQDIERIKRLPLANNEPAWSLVYSISIHKRSLEGMIRRIHHVSAEEVPLLILIKDTDKFVYGALLSSFVEIENVETKCVLFHIRPNFQQIQTTPESRWKNTTSEDIFSVVDASGKSGIWLNGYLKEGRLEEYKYAPPPRPFGVAKASSGPTSVEARLFQIKSLECWMLSGID